MGSAYHSERPVPKRPDLTTAGTLFSAVSSSRLDVAWNVLIWLKVHGACLDEELRATLLARLDVAVLNMMPKGRVVIDDTNCCKEEDNLGGL